MMGWVGIFSAQGKQCGEIRKGQGLLLLHIGAGTLVLHDSIKYSRKSVVCITAKLPHFLQLRKKTHGRTRRHDQHCASLPKYCIKNSVLKLLWLCQRVTWVFALDPVNMLLHTAYFVYKQGIGLRQLVRMSQSTPDGRQQGSQPPKLLLGPLIQFLLYLISYICGISHRIF